MKASRHFRYQVIGAGKWTRLEGTDAVGGTDEPRPHVIPTTEEAELFLGMNLLLPANGLCAGKVQLDDGSEKYAYRFIILKEEAASAVMENLDRLVEQDMEIVD